MFRLKTLGAAVACFALAAGAARIHASGHDRTLVVTMTNDPDTNQIKVYDADTRVLPRHCQLMAKVGLAATRVVSSNTTVRSWRSSTTDPAASHFSSATATD